MNRGAPLIPTLSRRERGTKDDPRAGGGLSPFFEEVLEPPEFQWSPTKCFNALRRLQTRRASPLTPSLSRRERGKWARLFRGRARTRLSASGAPGAQNRRRGTRETNHSRRRSLQ